MGNIQNKNGKTSNNRTRNFMRNLNRRSPSRESRKAYKKKSETSKDRTPSDSSIFEVGDAFAVCYNKNATVEAAEKNASASGEDAEKTRADLVTCRREQTIIAPTTPPQQQPDKRSSNRDDDLPSPNSPSSTDPNECTAEINQCYYSAESDSTTDELSKTNLTQSISNNFLEDILKDIAQISDTNMTCRGDLKENEHTENDKKSENGLTSCKDDSFPCENDGSGDVPDGKLKAGGTSFTLSKHRKVELNSTKLNEVCLTDSTPEKEIKRQASDSNVLRKVASLQMDQASSPDSKTSKTKFVPEKLDFHFYEKFEGHMLLNWFIGAINEDSNLKNILPTQDSKLLGSIYCNNLLQAGVLKQICDKDAPIEPAFKPELMYCWAHSETSPKVPTTPGKLSSMKWTPFGENKSITNNQHFTDFIKNIEKDFNNKIIELNNERDYLKNELSKLQQVITKSKESEEGQTQEKTKETQTDLVIDEQFTNLTVIENKIRSNEANIAVSEVLSECPKCKARKYEMFQTETCETPISQSSPMPGMSPVPPPPPMPGLALQPPPMPGLSPAPPPSPMTGMSPAPTPPPMPGLSPAPPPPPMLEMSPAPPPPPMPGMSPAPPPPPMPGMSPAPPPPPMPGMSPAPPPPPMPGMSPAPPPPPMPGMSPAPPPPPMPGISLAPPPPPMPGMSPAPPPPPMPGMSPAPPPLPIAGFSPAPPPMPGCSPVPPSMSGLTNGHSSPADGPKPFPTPPLGHWNTNKASLRKNPVKPPLPMKPLYWTRILAPADQTPLPAPLPAESENLEPLWTKLEETHLDNLNEFTELFARQVSTTTKVPKKVVQTSSKMKPVKILEGKRAQMVGILVQSLHFDFCEVENAIYNFDTSVVSLEALQQIYSKRATKEEERKLKEHVTNRPESPLDKPEQFLYELSTIPNFAERISCFVFQSMFDDNISSIMHQLENFSQTCDFLITNKRLKEVFVIILTLGNYMNGGNGQRGQADGFGLEILNKLKDVKSKESSITLLHFIVKTYIRNNDGALNAELPVPEPGDIARASAVSFPTLQENLAQLSTTLAECRRETEKVIADSEASCDDTDENRIRNNSTFKEKMIAFLKQADEKLNAEREHLKECHNKFIILMKFYQHTPKTRKLEDCEPSEFFDLWLQFCTDFKDIFKKEEKIAIAELLKKNRQKMMEKTKIVPIREGGLKARLQKLAKRM